MRLFLLALSLALPLAACGGDDTPDLDDTVVPVDASDAVADGATTESVPVADETALEADADIDATTDLEPTGPDESALEADAAAMAAADAAAAEPAADGALTLSFLLSETSWVFVEGPGESITFAESGEAMLYANDRLMDSGTWRVDDATNTLTLDMESLDQTLTLTSDIGDRLTFDDGDTPGDVVMELAAG